MGMSTIQDFLENLLSDNTHRLHSSWDLNCVTKSRMLFVLIFPPEGF